MASGNNDFYIIFHLIFLPFYFYYIFMHVVPMVPMASGNNDFYIIFYLIFLPLFYYYYNIFSIIHKEPHTKNI